MPFDCDVRTIEADTNLGGVAIPVQCKRWKCPICAPYKQRQLIAQGRAGLPTAFITITYRRRPGVTPIQASKELTAALATVVRRFKQEQRKPAGSRYIPKGPRKFQYNRAKAVRIAKREDRRKTEIAAHFWIMEEHKSGWPHMHILWRGRYVPQWWLSQQLEELIQSPIVDVRRVKNPAQRAAYVAKYCGKKPHQFGTTKRYSQTRNYKLQSEWSSDRSLPKGLRWIERKTQVHQVVKGWIDQDRQVYQLSPRLFMWGELVDPVTGEIFPRPPTAKPYEVGDVWAA